MSAPSLDWPSKVAISLMPPGPPPSMPLPWASVLLPPRLPLAAARLAAGGAHSGEAFGWKPCGMVELRAVSAHVEHTGKAIGTCEWREGARIKVAVGGERVRGGGEGGERVRGGGEGGERVRGGGEGGERERERVRGGEGGARVVEREGRGVGTGQWRGARTQKKSEMTRLIEITASTSRSRGRPLKRRLRKTVRRRLRELKAAPIRPGATREGTKSEQRRDIRADDGPSGECGAAQPHTRVDTCHMHMPHAVPMRRR